jgi:hypothetical protein
MSEYGRSRQPTAQYRRRPRVRVEQVGVCLVASVGGVRPSATTMARSLPEEEDRVAVVLSDADAMSIPELAEILQEWIPLGWDSIRLIAPNTARPAGDDLPVGQEIADLLGMEVLAPDGPLLAVPGGSLFVLGGQDGAERGVWRRLRPGRPPEAAGRRFPPPEWERAVAPFTDPGITGVVAEEVPAGIWLHWSGEYGPGDLAFALPVHESNMALVVSRAGDPPMRTADLRRVIQSLPDELQDRLALVPYGDEPIAEARLGAVASLASNRTLRVRTGMPMYLSGRGRQVVAIGPDGVPTWRPFARELAWRPHGGSRILSWAPPVEHLLPAGQAQLLLNERWLVEVIEAGLWVREVDRLEGAAAVRQLPLRSAYCTVVVGVEDESPSTPPWRTIVRMLRRLPVEARGRVRLAVPHTAGQRMVRAATRACNRVRRGGPVSVLTADGLLIWPRDPKRRRQSPPAGERRTQSPPVEERRRQSPPVEERRYRDEPPVDRRVRRPERPRPAVRDERPAPSRRTARRSDADEEVRLMGYVDELRRTPAWDEEPDDGAGYDGGHRRAGPPRRPTAPDAPPPVAMAPDAPPAGPPRPEPPPAVLVPDLIVSEGRDQVSRPAPQTDEEPPPTPPGSNRAGPERRDSGRGDPPPGPHNNTSSSYWDEEERR